MLRTAHVRLRPRPRRGPKFLSALPKPDVRRPWGDIGSFTREDRREVTAGAWRQARPVELVSIAESPGLAPAVGDASTPPAAGARAVSERPLVFASDEAAEDYLAEESADERAEARVPALRLAQDFFTDLASVADEEVDREAAGLHPPAPQSEEERRAEEAAVHRHFFADYYERQGLVGTAPGVRVSRDAFVRALLEPAVGLFQVNSERVLGRLIVRDQLECDVAGVFARTPSPMVYRVDAMPVEAFGDTPLLPATVESARLAGGADDRSTPQLPGGVDGRGEGAPVQEGCHSGSTPAALEDADAVAWAMLDALDDDTAPVVHPSADEAAPSPPGDAPPPHCPLTVGHLHWLQRRVAADELASVDLLSLVVSLLCTRLAAPAGVTASAARRPRLVWDPHGMAQRRPAAVSYYRDVALRASLCAAGGDAGAAGEVVVAVALPPPRTARGKGRSPSVSTSPTGSAVDGEDDLMLRTPASAIPYADRATNLLYVEPPAASHYRRRWWEPCPPLKGRCDVVLCAPPTSEDGARPRVALGDGAEDEPPVPNRFLQVCSAAAEHYVCLKRALTAAIHCAARADGGWVLYVTRSMNPIENEAVVCAVLTALRSGAEEAGCARAPTITCVPLTSALVTGALTAEEGVELASWLAAGGGLTGLDTWVAVEGAEADQDAASHDPPLRAEVAAASWRSTPGLSAADGAYLCLLRVHGSQPSLPAAAGADSSDDSGRADACSGRAAASLAEGAQGPELWVPHTVTHTSASRLACLLTPAAVAAVTAFTVVDSGPGRWRLICAGLPIAAADPAEPEHRLLSSAASGTSALADWVAGLRGAAAPPVVRTSALMLSELLRRRRLESHWLRSHLLRLSAGVSCEPVENAMTQAEIAALLTAVERVAGSMRLTPEGPVVRTVLLQPFIPQHAVCGGAMVAGVAGDPCAPCAAIHEAVLEELAALLVVARLELAPASSGTTTAAPSFSLTLTSSLSHAEPERLVHEAAIAEMAVGVRDALLYVLRRVGCPMDRLRLGEYAESAESEGEAERGGVGLPGRPPHMVSLHEDDYSVEEVGGATSAHAADGAALLSSRERLRTQTRLGRMAQVLRRENVPMDGRAAPGDWTRSVPAAYRRRWRDPRGSR